MLQNVAKFGGGGADVDGDYDDDDEDNREQAKTRTAKDNRFRLAKQQLCAFSTLFLHISLPTLHDHDMNIPNFTFCGGRDHNTTTFFFFS